MPGSGSSTKGHEGTEEDKPEDLVREGPRRRAKEEMRGFLSSAFLRVPSRSFADDLLLSSLCSVVPLRGSIVFVDQSSSWITPAAGRPWPPAWPSAGPRARRAWGSGRGGPCGPGSRC